MQVLKVAPTETELLNREAQDWIKNEKELQFNNVGVAYIMHLFYTHV